MPANFLTELTASLPVAHAQPLTAETRFREQPWWDSLAALIIMASFQSTFGKQITADQLRSCQTLGDVVRLGAK